MKNHKYLLPIVAVLLLAFTSCEKYLEDPSLSIRAEAERLDNNWKLVQVLDNEKDITSSYNKIELNLIKSGEASLSTKFVVLGTTFGYVSRGKWLFLNNKEKLSFDYDNNEDDGVYTILKLEEDEMWLKQEGSSVQLHYVTK